MLSHMYQHKQKQRKVPTAYRQLSSIIGGMDTVAVDNQNHAAEIEFSELEIDDEHSGDDVLVLNEKPCIGTVVIVDDLVSSQDFIRTFLFVIPLIMILRNKNTKTTFYKQVTSQSMAPVIKFGCHFAR